VEYIALYLAAVNLLTFIIYVWDKRCAVKGRRRVPERTLITLALLGGSPAALLGMLAARHKTRKPKFFIGVPAILALQLAAVIIYEVYLK
jgi:uncharacterized membrane protein YsdA (DUF1294 family)